MNGFEPRELEFFTLHLAEEQHHGNWLVEAVRKTARSEDDLQSRWPKAPGKPPMPGRRSGRAYIGWSLMPTPPIQLIE